MGLFWPQQPIFLLEVGALTWNTLEELDLCRYFCGLSWNFFSRIVLCIYISIEMSEFSAGFKWIPWQCLWTRAGMVNGCHIHGWTNSSDLVKRTYSYFNFFKLKSLIFLLIYIYLVWWICCMHCQIKRGSVEVTTN